MQTADVVQPLRAPHGLCQPRLVSIRFLGCAWSATLWRIMPFGSVTTPKDATPAPESASGTGAALGYRTIGRDDTRRAPNGRLLRVQHIVGAALDIAITLFDMALHLLAHAFGLLAAVVGHLAELLVDLASRLVELALEVVLIASGLQVIVVAVAVQIVAIRVQVVVVRVVLTHGLWIPPWCVALGRHGWDDTSHRRPDTKRQSCFATSMPPANWYLL